MRRSLMANFLDQLVQIKYRKKSPEEVEKFLRKKILKGESTYSLPFYLRFRSDINEHHTDGQQVYYLNSSSESDTLVVYLHGGAFVDEITPFHWNPYTDLCPMQLIKKPLILWRMYTLICSLIIPTKKSFSWEIRQAPVLH